MSNGLRQIFCLKYKMTILEELKLRGFLIKKADRDYLSFNYVICKDGKECAIDLPTLYGKNKRILKELLRKFNELNKTNL